MVQREERWLRRGDPHVRLSGPASERGGEDSLKRLPGLVQAGQGGRAGGLLPFYRTPSGRTRTGTGPTPHRRGEPRGVARPIYWAAMRPVRGVRLGPRISTDYSRNGSAAARAAKQLQQSQQPQQPQQPALSAAHSRNSHGHNSGATATSAVTDATALTARRNSHNSRTTVAPPVLASL